MWYYKSYISGEEEMKTKEDVAEKLKELLKEHKRVKDAGDQKEAVLIEGGILLLSWVLEVEKGAVRGEGLMGIEDEDSKRELAEFLIVENEDKPRREFSRVVFKENTDSIKVYPDRIIIKVGVEGSRRPKDEKN